MTIGYRRASCGGRVLSRAGKMVHSQCGGNRDDLLERGPSVGPGRNEGFISRRVPCVKAQARTSWAVQTTSGCGGAARGRVEPRAESLCQGSLVPIPGSPSSQRGSLAPMSAIPGGKRSVPWAARSSWHAMIPDGGADPELGPCPRRIKRLGPKWSPVRLFHFYRRNGTDRRLQPEGPLDTG